MLTETGKKQKLKLRSVWISDIHLGFRGCSAEFLLDFLHRVECDYLYLVGDIIDVWEMKKRMYWPQAHNNVIRTLLGKTKHNTKVIYVPGNHDEVLRDFDGAVFGNVEIQNEAIHTTADNRKLLILHGDQFDSVVKCSPMLAKLGGRLYDYLLRANRYVNFVRRKLGFPYWSLAAFLKHKVKNAVQYIGNFEEAVAREAAKQGVDGVVCGHIHRAEITRLHEIDYYNCGDWVESCTALVEHQDGTMEILSWTTPQEVAHAVANAA
jgi:UDP-2,3-diacylglucosamine pyrophosphatase LpxH